MMMFTYLGVLFATVVICAIASFHPRIRFDRHFRSYFAAAAVVAIPFIVWDIWFTMRGVWWFNLDYTIGFTVGGLPIEEWMFFVFIPFSCVFTYYSIDKFFAIPVAEGFNNLIAFVGVIVCSLIALLHPDKIYTFVTAVSTILVILYLHFVLRAEWLAKASLVYAILMLGFLPVNGILTGTGLQAPIVNYNPGDFLGIRIGTIPVEDAVYGYTQFLCVLGVFKFFQRRKFASTVM